MDACDVAHVVFRLEISRCLEDVFARPLEISQRFVVKAEVEVGVEELIVQLRGRGIPGLRGAKHVFRLHLARKQGVNLHHRHAGVALDGDERDAGLLDA